MPSPFPGMNPYLEQPDGWLDFHNTFLIVMREILTPQLVPRYYCRAEEHLYVQDMDAGPTALGRPDVSVHDAGVSLPAAGGTATAELAAPAKGRVPPTVRDEMHSIYLEVRGKSGGKVVTTIELLSPSNKERGDDREAYLRKVRRILGSSANLVEIDLLRGWPRMPWVGLGPCDYCVVVSRAETRPEVDIWPIGLRDSLPKIPIPLLPDEPPATIDLQALLHRVYDGAGFGYSIYDGEPTPRLAPADAAWAKSVIPEA